eukprot:363795-Chlamydomonas_euryale.AAC.11
MGSAGRAKRMGGGASCNLAAAEVTPCGALVACADGVQPCLLADLLPLPETAFEHQTALFLTADCPPPSPPGLAKTVNKSPAHTHSSRLVCDWHVLSASSYMPSLAKMRPAISSTVALRLQAVSPSHSPSVDSTSPCSTRQCMGTHGGACKTCWRFHGSAAWRVGGWSNPGKKGGKGGRMASGIARVGTDACIM